MFGGQERDSLFARARDRARRRRRRYALVAVTVLAVAAAVVAALVQLETRRGRSHPDRAAVPLLQRIALEHQRMALRAERLAERREEEALRLAVKAREGAFLAMKARERRR